MKKVLIILFFGGIISETRAAFETIPFDPRVYYLNLENNNSIQISGIKYSPYNFTGLKNNLVLSHVKLSSFSFNLFLNQLGDNLYKETSLSFQAIRNSKSNYNPIIGFNYYHLKIEQYGSSQLNTIDIGFRFNLLKHLNTFVLFKNIIKNNSSTIHDEINSNIMFYISDKISDFLSFSYLLNRINGQFNNHIINLNFQPKYIKLNLGFETLTRNSLVSSTVHTKFFSIILTGIFHPELGLSNQVGFEIKY